MKVWPLIKKNIEQHGACALVTVTATQGSAPRDAGARMVVTKEGYHGSIGGGALEWQAIAAAQAMLSDGAAARKTSHALGPELGQCCGGRVDLLTQVFDASSVIEADTAVADRRIYLYGAGHVGRALVMALAPLPFEVIWIDARADAFPGAVPQNVSIAANADLAAAPEGSFVYIMTHSHALDFAICDQALRNPSIAQVGLIGSATKRARFEKRLTIATARLICPIGVPGLKSKLPPAIAAATAAQILLLDEATSFLPPLRGRWREAPEGGLATATESTARPPSVTLRATPPPQGGRKKEEVQW